MIHPQSKTRKTKLLFPIHFLLLLLLTPSPMKMAVRHCKIGLEFFDVRVSMLIKEGGLSS